MAEGRQGRFVPLQPGPQRELRPDAGRIALRQGEGSARRGPGPAPASTLGDAVAAVGAVEILAKA